MEDWSEQAKAKRARCGVSRKQKAEKTKREEAREKKKQSRNLLHDVCSELSGPEFADIWRMTS